MNGQNSRLAPVFNHIKSAPKSIFKDMVSKLQRFTGISGKHYEVKETLSAEEESAILLCERKDSPENLVVAKIFQKEEQEAETKERILSFMHSKAGRKIVLPVEDIGLVQLGTEFRHYFEIYPYIESGDLSKAGKVEFSKLKDMIRQLNELLQTIHNAGIVHYDIKPEHLYEQNGILKISDFDIAHFIDEKFIDKIEGMNGYTDPKLYIPNPNGKYGIDPTSDYYSLGVTLACLYSGKDISEKIKNQVNNSDRVSLPLNDRDGNSKKLENLINGLVYRNTNSRFGYEGVKKWLEDPSYTRRQFCYTFYNKEYFDEADLFEAITQNEESWEEALKDLQDGNMRNGLMQTEHYSEIRDEFDSAENDQSDENLNLRLSRILMGLYPNGGIVWGGRPWPWKKIWQSLEELGEEMKDTETPWDYMDMLQKGIISFWMEKMESNSENIELVKQIEDVSKEWPDLACYWFGFSYSHDKRWKNVYRENIDNVESFVNLFFSPINCLRKNLFKILFPNGTIYSQLMSLKKGAKLYGFLCSFGYWQVLKQAINEKTFDLDQRELDRFEKILLMIDKIGQKEGANMRPLRKFYMVYGPMAPVVYIYEIQQRKKIYQAVKPEGRDIIEKLTTFQIPQNAYAGDVSVEELQELQKSMLEIIGQLKAHTQDNPFLLEYGIVDSKDIICNNLEGCFALKFLDMTVPLGLEDKIKSDYPHMYDARIFQPTLENMRNDAIGIMQNYKERVSNVRDNIQNRLEKKSSSKLDLDVVCSFFWIVALLLILVFLYSKSPNYRELTEYATVEEKLVIAVLNGFLLMIFVIVKEIKAIKHFKKLFIYQNKIKSLDENLENGVTTLEHKYSNMIGFGKENGQMGLSLLPDINVKISNVNSGLANYEKSETKYEEFNKSLNKPAVALYYIAVLTWGGILSDIVYTYLYDLTEWIFNRIFPLLNIHIVFSEFTAIRIIMIVMTILGLLLAYLLSSALLDTLEWNVTNASLFMIPVSAVAFALIYFIAWLLIIAVIVSIIILIFAAIRAVFRYGSGDLPDH